MGYFLPVFPPVLILQFAGLEKAKNLAGKCLPPDSDLFTVSRFYKTSANLSSQTST
jgi:hypothetical protein